MIRLRPSSLYRFAQRLTAGSEARTGQVSQWRGVAESEGWLLRPVKTTERRLGFAAGAARVLFLEGRLITQETSQSCCREDPAPDQEAAAFLRRGVTRRRSLKALLQQRSGRRQRALRGAAGNED